MQEGKSSEKIFQVFTLYYNAVENTWSGIYNISLKSLFYPNYLKSDV